MNHIIDSGYDFFITPVFHRRRCVLSTAATLEAVQQSLICLAANDLLGAIKPEAPGGGGMDALLSPARTDSASCTTQRHRPKNAEDASNTQLTAFMSVAPTTG